MTEEPGASGAHHRISTLGEGGMGRVYLAVAQGPLGFSKLLVIKELKPTLASEPEFLAMFQEEARLAARLNHPNVIHTYEVGTEGDHYVIVMEYLEGQSLGTLLNRVTRLGMPLDEHVAILIRALAGLHYAHELTDFDGAPLGMVHRDVSPHNVFITYDGQVKLVDFGIAKAAGSAQVTQSGVFKGKISYAAPEQTLGKHVDRRADIFAMGVLLWEALARKRLVNTAELDISIIHRRAMGQEPSIREVQPDAPAELAAICDRAMAAKREDRFATAAEFQAALVAYLDRSGKRIGDPEIGALLSKVFAEERSKVRALIDESVKRLKGEAVGRSTQSQRAMVPQSASTARLLALSASPESMPASGAAPASEKPSDTGGQPVGLPTTSTAPTASTRPAPFRRVVTASLLLATTAGVFFVLTRMLPQVGQDAHAVAAVGLPSEPRPAAPSSGASSSTSGAEQLAALAPPMVELTIRAQPAEAQVFLDDVALAHNPFHAMVPSNGTMHRVRAVAPGFVTEEQMVVFRSGEAPVTFTLKRGAPGKRGAAQASSWAAPVTSPVASPIAPPASGSMGDDLSVVKAKPKPIIDEKDPYAK